MINAQVVGNLVSAPELKFTPAGKAVANTSIAVNHGRKDEQGNWQETGVTFLRIALWGHQAEEAAEHLTKGQKVIATGRIETRKYTTKDGTEGESLEMQVYDIGPVLAKFPPRDQQSGGQSQQWGNSPQPNNWPAKTPAPGEPWTPPAPQQGGGGGWDAPQQEPPF